MVRHKRRRIRDGDTYTIDEEADVKIIGVEQVSDPPPEETRGEPWGWTKGAPFPRGYREDGNYGSD